MDNSNGRRPNDGNKRPYVKKNDNDRSRYASRNDAPRSGGSAPEKSASSGDFKRKAYTPRDGAPGTERGAYAGDFKKKEYHKPRSGGAAPERTAPAGDFKKKEYNKPRTGAAAPERSAPTGDYKRKDYNTPRTGAPAPERTAPSENYKAKEYAQRFDALAPDNRLQDEEPYFIMGRNAVREAVKSGRSIDRILVVEEKDGSLREVIALARDRRLVIVEVTRAKLDQMCLPYGHGGKTGNHQGIIALVPPIEYAEIKDILALARERGQAPFVIVLDGIEDPHNLGSIIRSAECAGAHGVVIPKRRAASVTTTVGKASAGAIEYIKIAKVTNIQSALEELKKAGLWIAGTAVSGTPMAKASLKGPIALVIGSEGDGIAPLTARNCDMIVSIPLRGKIESLNASVAAAVLMFEKLRQDGVV